MAEVQDGQRGNMFVEKGLLPYLSKAGRMIFLVFVLKLLVIVKLPSSPSTLAQAQEEKNQIPTKSAYSVLCFN